jgi:5'-methylthioadenosine phosphorylase
MTSRPPTATGHRLAVIVGSSIVEEPFPQTPASTVRVPGRAGEAVDIEVRDHGTFVSMRRHGASLDTPAHRVDHHAHIRALVEVGCDRVLALGSCGGLRAQLLPGTLLAPDDFLALGSYETFHSSTDGYGVRGIDADWRDELIRCWPAEDAGVRGGTYAQVRGPRFETRAEIRLLAAFADVVGMTLAAECFLAAEAGLRYAAMCHIDNLANGVGVSADVAADYRVAAADQGARLADQLSRTVSRLT